MANSCIAQHTPHLAARHKELVDGGIMTDKEAAFKVAIEEHKKLHDELNTFKKSIGVKQTPYTAWDKSKEVADIKKEYAGKIVNAIKAVQKVIAGAETTSSVSVATYYDTQIANLAEAKDLRSSDGYKEHIEMIKSVAAKMGLEITGIDETVGGFTNAEGNKITEISNRVKLNTKDLDNAEEFAAVVGALAHETQEATIASKYVEHGDSNQSAIEVELKVNDLGKTIKALESVGINDYEANESEGTIKILDFDNGMDLDFNNKMANLAKELSNKNIKYDTEHHAIESRYVSPERRTELLKAAKLKAEQSQGGTDIRNLYEEAAKQSEKFLNKNKKEQPSEPTQGDNSQPSFSIQTPTTQEISDMKDIVKDYVDEGTASLKEIQNDVAKEMGDNSQEMKDLVEKAYNEFTNENAPKELIGGIVGKVGQFLSNLFGGKASEKIWVSLNDISFERMKEKLTESGAEVKLMKAPDGKTLGLTVGDKIYLNGEYINPKTIVHEAGHIWTEWTKQNNPEVYTRGMQLTENSKYLKEVKANEFYKEEASKLGSESSKAYSDYMKHEALAMAIGDKGAQFVGEARKKDFKEWLNNLWSKIKEAAGFKDITTAELQNLTFDEFTKRAAADILREQEQAQPQDKKKATPKQKAKSKLSEAEVKVIYDVLNKPINEKEFPTFFDMNQQGVQQTAKTQGEGQERKPLDGTYVQAHLADLRSISLNNARILQDTLGDDWKEKIIGFFEENPTAGNIAQVSGLLNVINTDINNEILKSKNGTEISKLKDIQARADRITYETSRSASLALNQRRMYQDFGQGKDVVDILSAVILTPEQQDLKTKAEEILKQQFTDEELNKPKPPKPKATAKPKAPKPIKQKNDDTVKKDLISKGKRIAQQTDADGNVTTVSLQDKIKQANDALNGFKC